MRIIAIPSVLMIAVMSVLLTCAEKSSYRSPAGFDLSKPVKYALPGALKEISGIAFNKGESTTIYAEDDEEGKVYYFKLGDKAVKSTEFKEHGDFEDIAICGKQVVMLQSKGTLFTIPLSEIGKPQTNKAKKLENILPEGEFEGLCTDENANQIYVLCKHCSIDKTSKRCSGFIFDVGYDGNIKSAGDFKLTLSTLKISCI
jgi:hypothetical protein